MDRKNIIYGVFTGAVLLLVSLALLYVYWLKSEVLITNPQGKNTIRVDVASTIARPPVDRKVGRFGKIEDKLKQFSAEGSTKPVVVDLISDSGKNTESPSCTPISHWIKRQCEKIALETADDKQNEFHEVMKNIKIAMFDIDSCEDLRNYLFVGPDKKIVIKRPATASVH